jgi:hypothetical protein
MPRANKSSPGISLDRYRTLAVATTSQKRALQNMTRRTEGANLLTGPFAGRAVVQAGNHRRPMHVAADTTFNDCFHPLLLEGATAYAA